MKQIIIDCCKHCPYASTFITNMCRYPGNNGVTIYDVNKIDKNCPLDNVADK
jgi:hypothetical protein